MAGITGRTCITVPLDIVVFVGKVRSIIVLMAIDAAERRKIVGRRMAFRTLVPFAPVISAVDRENLVVVVKGGRRPGCFRMAACAIGGKLGGCMVGVAGLVVVGRMAAETGIGGIAERVVVAGRAVVGYCGMRPV